MPRPASPALPLTERQRRLMEQHARKTTASERGIFRVQVILNGGGGMSDAASARALGKTPKPIKKWRKRWLAGQDQLIVFERGVARQGVTDLALLRYILQLLGDAPRSGRPDDISETQKQQIVALSCEEPTQHGLPVTMWTHQLLAQTAIKKNIVDKISSRHVGVILKKSTSTT